MDFQRFRRSYYADFIITPLLIGGALSLCPADAIARFASVALFALVLWTFAEYWIHRALFHIVFKQSHWRHHTRPQGFDTIPWWLTLLVQLVLGAALIASAGVVIGGGLFLGLEAGYLAYIVVHDRIHHSPKAKGGYWRRVARRHAIHHRGLEVNFGVITAAWDRVFGTFDGR